MAKSTRSKVKRSFRSKKRETGVYAANEAARLHRLNSKLVRIATQDKDGDIPLKTIEGENEETPVPNEVESSHGHDAMAVDQQKAQRISTHGPRGSRREEWRTSKGLSARPAPNGMNRQGGIAARRKAGRSKRRR